MQHFFIKFVIGLTLTIVPFALVHAESPEERGLEIAIATDKRDTGWKHVIADMEMILKSRAGKESRRRLSNRQLEVTGDGDKSLSLFKEPKDIAGTAQLTFSHGLEPDDQWLYLPSIKRVKRISSKNKSGSFMGSEFAFEDLGSQEVDKYKYQFLGEEPCGDGYDCYINERIPQYKHSAYTKQIAWIDKEHYRTVKIEFYDRKGALLKTLDFLDYKEYPGGFWRADQFEMTNHQTGKSTSLLWSNYDFDYQLDAGDFNKNALKRLL